MTIVSAARHLDAHVESPGALGCGNHPRQLHRLRDDGRSARAAAYVSATPQSAPSRRSSHPTRMLSR